MSESRLKKLEALMEEARRRNDIWMMLVIHDEMKKFKDRWIDS